MIQEFANELRKRVQERDPFASVKVFGTPSTMVTGEYVSMLFRVSITSKHMRSVRHKNLGLCVIGYELKSDSNDQSPRP